MTAPPVGARDIMEPPTVITPPGVKVCDPMTNCDCAFSVNVEEPMTTAGIVISGAFVGVGDGKVITSPSAVMALPGKRV